MGSKPEELTEEMLITAMLHPDVAIARIARQLWDRRHGADPEPATPAHCDECFEGCPKCDPGGWLTR